VLARHGVGRAGTPDCIELEEHASGVEPACRMRARAAEALSIRPSPGG